MTTRTKTLVMVAMIPLLAGVACSKVKARAAFKEGNKLYKEENYRKAIEQYERSVALEATAEGYFYLGSSNQNLFRPTKADDPENRAHLDKAVECYLRTLELADPGNEAHLKVRVNALGALTGIYSEPPFEAFDKALGYAQELTKDNPDDSKNLYAIANLYERFNRVSEAEATYLKITEANPEDVKACGALATFYNKTYWDADGSIWTEDSKKPKRSRFKDSVSTLERCTTVDPTDPTGYFKVATFYWNAAYRDADLTDKQKDEYADLGLAAIDKALNIKPDYWEAVIYKGLLFRVKAQLTRDPVKRAEWIDKAGQLQKLALDLRKEQQASDKELPPEAQATDGGTGAGDGEPSAETK